MIIAGFPVFRVMFFALPLVYMLLYAPYGFGSHDTGFILGSSWQFFSGAIPYADIISVRPPTSYIFHSIVFFANPDLSVIIDRAIFYIEVAIYSYLAVSLLAMKFEYGSKSFIYFLSCVSFIITSHTFSPMGWHTVDGIFFSMSGIYILLTRKNNIYIILGSALLVIGALSKQSFFLIPFMTLGYIFLQREYKKLSYAFVTMFLFVGLFFYYLDANNALGHFVEQITGTTKLDDLLRIGVASYFKEYKSIVYIALPPLFVSGLISKFRGVSISSTYFYSLLYWILMFNLYSYIKNDTFMSPTHNYADVLFIFSCCVVFVKSYTTKDEKYYLVILLLTLAWSAALSWGYPTVILFSAPMIFILASSIYNEFHEVTYKALSLVLIMFAFFTYYVGYQTPYNLDHAVSRSELTHDMGEVFPRLKYIKADQKTYLEYQELKALIATTNGEFTVLPAATLIHFLSNTLNPIGVDWVMNAEVNYQYDAIIRKLELKHPVVFVRKGEITKDGKFGSNISLYIREHWLKVREAKFYDTYVFKPIPLSKEKNL